MVYLFRIPVHPHLSLSKKHFFEMIVPAVEFGENATCTMALP
jgi:hypothetical protein